MDIGLYRDDGLAILKQTPREIERVKKEICKIFAKNDLRITIEANKKVVNFLDVTLDLSTENSSHIQNQQTPRSMCTANQTIRRILSEIFLIQ